MRSLTPTGCSVYGLEVAAEGSKLSKIAVDPETGIIYATSEQLNEGVEVDILKFERLEDGTTTTEVCVYDCMAQAMTHYPIAYRQPQLARTCPFPSARQRRPSRQCSLLCRR